VGAIKQEAFLASAGLGHQGEGAGVSKDTIVVAGHGVAHLYVRSGFSWVEQAVLTVPASPPVWDFGFSAKVSGNTLVVGARNEPGGDFYSGAAFVFIRIGTNWVPQAVLRASNTETHDFFGTSVAIEGDTIVVGAPNEGSDARGINGDQ